MKKILLSVTLICVISFSIFAQTWTKSAAQEGNMPTSWVCNFGGGGGVWGGDLWLSGTLPANVEFTFTGTQVRIVGIPVNAADFTNDGINSTVDISIDGVLIEDNYTGWIQNTSDVGNVLIWTSATLPSGAHKIKVELNGNEIGINAFEYVTAPVEVWTKTNVEGAATDPLFNVTDLGGGGIWDNDLWLGPNGFVEYTFTGTQVRIVGIPVNSADFVNDGLNSTADIFIDGVLIEDNFTGWIQNTADVPNILIWTSAILVEGKHTIKVFLNANEIGINAFEYNAPAAILSTILDDKDAGFTWTGFELDEQAEAYGGQQHVAEATGSVAEFEFTGRSIKFYGETWNGGPSLEIFIDGLSKGTFSQSITPEGLKNLFATIAGLEDVKHSVKLVSIGEWAALDYVEYTSESIVLVPDPNVTVSGDNADPWGEGPDKLNDGDLNTKWSVETNTAWIQFEYKEAKTWNKYSLTSGNDAPTRDFKDWTLQGSDDGATWTILDTQTGHPEWATRNSTLDFGFTNLSAYKFYKFDVTANNGSNVTQLSEIAFSFALEEEALIFTTTGTAAPYITYNNWYSHQADSVYMIEKTVNPIVVDGEEESAWSEANAALIKKIAHEKKLGDELDLSIYPQSEADLKTTYKAMWTTEGVYMFIDVKDDFVRYQNPDYQWENDGIEFYFAKAVGEGKIQIIIPAMVGTTNPASPEAKVFESGSAVGSDPAYKVFGFDAENWDETLFNWAIKKTATGYAMEVYMDKDIITNGNSDTNFGLGKMFAGDINVDEADEKQNDNDPALYIREGSLALLGNSNQEYASSNYYGTFKMVNDVTTAINTISSSDFNVFYSSANKQITIRSNSVVSATLYNIAGQAMTSKYMDGKMNVANLKSGIYIIYAKDANGNRVGSSKVAIF
jgi:hypothetical protein